MASTAEKKMYRVRATQLGNYGLSLKKPGDEVEIDSPMAFAEEWMEALDEIPSVDKSAAPIRKPADKAVYSPAKKPAQVPKPAAMAQAELHSVSDDSPL